jgi:hypothetical protein
MRTELFAASLAAGLALGPVPATAWEIVDTTLGEGIHTTVADAFGDGTGVQIHTSVARVGYDPPVAVRGAGFAYLEVHGSVQGTGWGGGLDDLAGPGPTSAAEAHYGYDVPFVLRWRASFDGTLVHYAHGRMNLGLNAFADQVLGPANEGRRLHELESVYATEAAWATDPGAAVFAPNLSGLGLAGEFSATALEGPFAGAPLNLSLDVPITRDLARVAQRLLAQLTGRPVRRTLGVGHSGGALILQFVAGGVSTPLEGPHAFQRVFTGGNYAEAYRPETGRIFDGVIPIGGFAALLHPAFPATAPMMLVAGEADYAAVDSVVYTNRLLRAGVDLPAMVRVYQVSGLPHNFAEVVESTPRLGQLLASFGVEMGDDSDRFVPVLAAALAHLREWVDGGVAPPPSRIDGRPIDGNGDGTTDAIAFAQRDGLSTSLFPHAQDPAIDRVLAEQLELTNAAGFPGTVRRYAEVLDALPHSGALELPYVRCRLGGFDYAAGAVLRPFDDLAARWSNQGRYRACVEDALQELAREGLYDLAVGQRVVLTAENLARLGH